MLQALLYFGFLDGFLLQGWEAGAAVRRMPRGGTQNRRLFFEAETSNRSVGRNNYQVPEAGRMSIQAFPAGKNGFRHPLPGLEVFCRGHSNKAVNPKPYNPYQALDCKSVKP